MVRDINDINLNIFHSSDNHDKSDNRSIFKLVDVHFEKVEVPLTLIMFFLLVLFVKVLIIQINKVSEDKFKVLDYAYSILKGIPESCLLILLGLFIGSIMPHRTAESVSVEVVNILLRG